MIVAITGGTGFIGSALAKRHLDRGDQVRVLSRDANGQGLHNAAYIWVDGDLVSGRGLADLVDGADVLYHAAGQLTNQSQMRDLHVEGTRRLVGAAKGHIPHWVQLSSVGVYGPVSQGSVSEASPDNPVGEYETTKAESDRIVLDAAAQGAFTCSILRPSNVFGPDMKNQSLFGMIRMIERGMFFFIGRKGASANYIHVDNVVEGLVRCATMPQAKGRVYNLSDHCSMERFVQILCDELGKKVPALRLSESPVRLIAKLFGSISGFPLTEQRVDAMTNHSVYPIQRIQEELDYAHVTSMENGLRQLVAAYRSKP